MGGIKKTIGRWTGATARKEAAREQKAAIAEQRAILATQEQKITDEEKVRKERVLQKRQGRRSLLHKEGTEAGVKANVLGG